MNGFSRRISRNFVGVSAEFWMTCPVVWRQNHSGRRCKFLGVFAVLDIQFVIDFGFVIQMLYICDIIYNEKDYEYGSI